MKSLEERQAERAERKRLEAEARKPQATGIIDPTTSDDESGDELKQDGPTIAEWVASGYSATAYPPSGYASKSTKKEVAAAIKAEADKANGGGTGATGPADPFAKT